MSAEQDAFARTALSTMLNPALATRTGKKKEQPISTLVTTGWLLFGCVTIPYTQVTDIVRFFIENELF